MDDADQSKLFYFEYPSPWFPSIIPMSHMWPPRHGTYSAIFDEHI